MRDTTLPVRDVQKTDRKETVDDAAFDRAL